jgi:hypothetical protein
MYDVRWIKSAMAELADVWLRSDSTEHESITAATAEIDVLLKIAPSDVGESRVGKRRIGFVHPLAFTSDVEEENGKVRIAHVWRY